MKTFDFTVTDPQGFHARPAGMLVKEAKKYPCKITIAKGGKNADAAKMFALLGLGIKCGETITISIDGEQEETAAAAIEAFLKDNM